MVNRADSAKLGALGLIVYCNITHAFINRVLLIKLNGWLLMPEGVLYGASNHCFCFVVRAQWDEEIRFCVTEVSPDPLCIHLHYIWACGCSPSGFSDFCLPPSPFPCHEMADCENKGYNYTCKCKPGYTGDGLNCTGERSREQARDTVLNSNWAKKVLISWIISTVLSLVKHWLVQFSWLADSPSGETN